MLLFMVIDLVILQVVKNDIKNFYGSEVNGYSCIIYERVLHMKFIIKKEAK